MPIVIRRCKSEKNRQYNGPDHRTLCKSASVWTLKSIGYKNTIDTEPSKLMSSDLTPKCIAFRHKNTELLIIYTTQMTFNRCMCNYSLTLYMPNNVLEMFEA
jgi:hypothetical protein